MTSTYTPAERAELAEVALDRGDHERAAELAVEAALMASQAAEREAKIARRAELADTAELAAQVAREADPTGKAGDRATRYALHVGELAITYTDAELAEDEAADGGRVVRVYTAPACPQCTATKRKLTDLGIDFTEVDLTDPDNEEERDYVVNDLGHSTVPVVEVDGEDHWDGYRPDRLKALAS